MTSPTIEQRARAAAAHLQAHADVVGRSRPSVDALESRVRHRRVYASIATAVLAVAAALTFNWATPGAQPPLVGEGPQPSEAADPTVPPSVDTRDQGQILARPSAGDTAPAGAEQPDSCGSPSRVVETVTLVVGPDDLETAADIRDAIVGCVVLADHQQLRITATDGAYQPFTATLGGWRFRLAPNQTVLLDLPARDYLEAGMHDVETGYEPAQAQVMFLPAPTERSGPAHLTDPPFATPWDDATGHASWSCGTNGFNRIELRIDGLDPGTELWWQLADGEGHANRYPTGERSDLTITTAVGEPTGEASWRAVDGTFLSQLEWDFPLDGRTLLLVTHPPHETTPGQRAVPTQLWEASEAGGVHCD